MNKINKEEMFGHLKSFLKSKGIELQDGSYTERIRRGCGLLADSVNLSQRAVKRARAAVDQRLDQMRQVIHERTAPGRSAGAQPDKPGTRKSKATVKRKTPVAASRKKRSPGSRSRRK